ncbi:MAG: glycosyltransferase [Marinomonas sp.]
MTNPKISVVMPIYNVEPYVADAIHSVLLQSFEDFELICVDDGGTDRSMEIVQEFKDPRIRIVSQTNMGLAAARNSGIAHANGEFVALLDSDDCWHKDKLMLHYIHLTANPQVGVSYAGSRFIDKNGAKLDVAMRPKIGPISSIDILCRNPIGNGSAPVLRREHLERAAYMHAEVSNRKCWFDESFRQSEDIEMWVRLAVKHGVLFEGIGGLLTEYRIIAGALSANVVKQYLSWNRMLRKTAEYAPEFTAKHGDRARAYQLRYLARRSLQLGNVVLAKDFLARSFKLKPKIIIEEPRKSVITSGAVLAGLILGKRRFSALLRSFLKEAAC